MIIKEKIAVVTSKHLPDPFLMCGVPVNEDGYFTILDTQDIEIEFDMPSEIELRGKKIANLENARTKTVADCQLEIERIDSDIQSLMALEAS